MRNAGLRLFGLLALLTLVEAVLLLAPGALRINGHEGDLIHTIDASARIAEGAVPHVDFLTPLGVLTFAPIAWLMRAGVGPGHAFILAQVLFAVLALPLIWRAAHSRLGGRLAIALGMACVVMATAMVYGGDGATSALSMYYNRWAWVLGFVVVVTIMLPPRPGQEHPWLDGAIIGIAMAVVFALKVTYVLALFPALVVYALSSRAWGQVLAGLVAGVAVLALVSAAMGSLALWPAYFSDLVSVLNSPFKLQPGGTLANTLAAPAYLIGTLLLVATVVLWRQSANPLTRRAGLMLLVLAPGFYYVTFQNWGNDPKWLFLLGVLLLSVPLAPQDELNGWPAGRLAVGMALAAFVIIAPSFLNMAYSPLRHLALKSGQYTTVLPAPWPGDVQVPVGRNYQAVGRSFLPPLGGPADGQEVKSDDYFKTSVLGEELPSCQLEGGLLGIYQHVADTLAAMPEVRGTTVLNADLNEYLWLLGPFQRNRGMAPWYYGDARGFDAAQYVVVPLCPVSPQARHRKLEVITDELGWTLEIAARDPHFILLRRLAAE